MYRRTRKYNAERQRRAQATRDRKRLDGPVPAYPAELPELRMRINHKTFRPWAGQQNQRLARAEKAQSGLISVQRRYKPPQTRSNAAHRRNHPPCCTHTATLFDAGGGEMRPAAGAATRGQ